MSIPEQLLYTIKKSDSVHVYLIIEGLSYFTSKSADQPKFFKDSIVLSSHGFWKMCSICLFGLKRPQELVPNNLHE